ncbi:MAG: FtsW/RodA/SpoVE family cell cycle protein [Coriobacteriales bacterium]|jgi:cell division protein FtsI/penicillin-binding protein 2/cell division protein FtsW (lipid II flippase)
MSSWRSTELLLILGATPVVALISIMSIITGGNAITFETLAVPIGLFLAFIAAHFAVCRLAPNADNALLPITYLLSGIGIAFVFRLAPDLATNQLIWLFAGIALMVLTLVFVPSLSALSRYKYTMMVFGLLLLLLPIVAGVEIYGSKIWLSIGGFSFQPGELAKILIVLFLAAYLAENREMLSVSSRRILGMQLPDFKTLFPLVFMLLVSIVIVVFERDLGSALLFFGLFLVMIYVCTGRISFVVISLIVVGIVGVLLYLSFSHIQARFAVWIDPFEYAQDTGYQLVQALYSMADGGMFGVGIGKGMPTTIPIVESDFIFAAFAEEMGLLGASGVLLLFVLFAIRGFATAARARRDVDAFAAVGLTAAISLQAFVIVGGVTGFIPLTGVTLPFMSQGGSSLISSFIIVGLLLRTGDDGTGTAEELTMFSRSMDGGTLGRRALGKRLTRILTVFCILFALLIANLTNIMVVRAEALQTMPSNNHTLAHHEQIERGSITTADDVTLAESVLQDDGFYAREYPQGDLAPQVLGYYSLRYGTAGLEASLDQTLTGNRNFSTITGAITSLSGGTNPGNSVQLTIDSRIQRAAQDALGGYDGACVVLDPETGAVLGMASGPDYDVNEVEDLLAGDVETDALFNRATQGLYSPGSTFKTVTLATAIENKIATLDTEYYSPGELEIGGGKVTSFDGNNLGTITLQEAFAYSSNTVFAQVGEEIGDKMLVAGSNAFGFGKTVSTDFNIRVSLMPDPNEMILWETAWAAVGQPVGEHDSPAGPQATPIQMAMVAACIANDGKIMTPYLVDNVKSPEGAVVTTTKPSEFASPISAETASKVRTAMEDVVDYGTGTGAYVEGAIVYGKTGTAQTSIHDDNSWFIGTAEAGGRKVTIAIVLEDYDEPVTFKAADVFETSLEALGAL